ncbi:hypothetical protein PFZ55_31330 [Streptomyces sp. MS2A]|nr:hypothetical protein [Streptomyces sp. MS2A]
MTLLSPPATTSIGFPRPHPDRGEPQRPRRDIRRAADASARVIERLSRRAALPVLRVALAAIMIWFGAPKLVPGGSPAETIAVDTVSALSGGLVTGDLARLILGILEVGLGVALLIPRLRFLALLALIGHMCATFTPLLLFPGLTWHAPLVGSLEGQYILKNLVLIGAILVLLGFSREEDAGRR